MRKVPVGVLIAFAISLACGATRLTGSWEAHVDVIPNIELSYIKFTLGITTQDITLSTTSVFDGDKGFTEERLGLEGHVGPFNLAGEALISPIDVVLKSTPYTIAGDPATPPTDPPAVEWKILGPIYRWAYLRFGLSFAGVDFSFKIEHFLEHVLEFSYGDFGQNWSTSCSPNIRYLLVSRDREIDVSQVTISYYADAAKTILLKRETVEGPFEVLPDLSDYTPAARTYLENLATARAVELGAAAFDIPLPQTGDLVFKLWVPHYMRYTFTAAFPPFTTSFVFDDVSTGIQFVRATVSLDDFQPCCGIGVSAELSFTKCRGFEYLDITLEDALKLCCGLDFDITIHFTSTHKTVALDFDGILWKPCVRIYAEPEFLDGFVIGGLSIYGIELYCQFDDCSYAKFLTAFDVVALEEILEEDIFQGDEYEYLEVGVCGQACCGGRYQFTGFIFFQESGSFMGITRVGAELTFPFFPGFTFGFKWDTTPLFSFTWKLSF
ncbi:hypothetical protein ACVNPS_02105 [Candidatus Bipolaricaulota sp. J31]